MTAVQAILDRAFGKAPQHIEPNLNVIDRLSFAEKEALLAALDELDV